MDHLDQEQLENEVYMHLEILDEGESVILPPEAEKLIKRFIESEGVELELKRTMAGIRVKRRR